MATHLGTNPARVHRLETGRLRSGRLIDQYETALGMPAGSLRAPIDLTCRGFAYAPKDSDPGDSVTSVREMSTLTNRVTEREVTGGDWLAWARAIAQPGAIGLPESQAETLVRKLISELGRSISHAYATRYEALSLVRSSAYGYLVLAVAKDVVEDPHTQVLYDMMSAVGEAPTPDAIAWCLGLLDQDREQVVVGGALAMENMAEVHGHDDFWATPIMDQLIEVLNRHPQATAQHEWLSHLVRLAPPTARRRARARLHQPLAPKAKISDWSRTRLNDHWSECESRAHTLTEQLCIPDQPLLARLLFEIAVGPHESRAVTSYFLLGALPRLRTGVGRHVADLAENHQDPIVRQRASRRLAGTLHGDHADVADRWITAHATEERDRGFILAGAAGQQISEPQIRQALLNGPHGPPLYAAGMAGSPYLHTIANDPSLNPEIRGAASWWQKQGQRISR